MNGGELFGVHGDALVRNNVAKIFDRRFVEFALLWIGVEASSSKTIKDHADGFVVVFLIPGIDENVVQVNNTANVDDVREYRLDIGLEIGRSVGKTERHHCHFVKSKVGSESRLPFVPFSDPDKIESIFEVDD